MKQKVFHNFRFRLATLLIVTTVGFSQWTSDTGVVYEIETTHHSGARGSAETTRMSILTPNLLKMNFVSQEGGSSDAIRGDIVFRGDRREIVVIDHRERSYMVFDKKTIDDMGKQLNEVKAMTEKMNIPQAALDQMPEEQRKKLEAMMGKGQSTGTSKVAEVEYKNTGETATKNGYPCVKYEVTRNGKMFQELWLTDWDNVEGGQAAQVVFAEMAGFLKEMMSAVGDILGGSDLFGGSKSVDSFTELDGIPVVSRQYDGGELESESVLRSASRQTLDPTAFEPPAGYKRRTMMR